MIDRNKCVLTTACLVARFTMSRVDGLVLCVLVLLLNPAISTKDWSAGLITACMSVMLCSLTMVKLPVVLHAAQD